MLPLVLHLIFSNAYSQEKGATTIGIIPKPNYIELQEGFFLLNKNFEIKYESDFEIAANFIKKFISQGISMDMSSKKPKRPISFIKDSTIQNQEAYKLIINPKEITIKASTGKGAFYATQSLRQLFPSDFENGTFRKKKLNLPCLMIEDAPQFSYRGMHLDVGRHMFSIKFIKRYIDFLAMLKMNTFHWHLTEDQGWRIEIKKYPKLNEISSLRKETLIGHYSDKPHKFDGKTYGGFYSQQNMLDVVQYANDRFITVIPEIEMPGHSQAVLAAYPELGCSGEPVEVATKWGVFEDIYCTKEQTFDFLEDVLDEVLDIFPSEYIHIGGDEAPKTRWKSCLDCQKRIADEGLKDEHELQNYFISRIERYLNSKERQIIGWDEILEGGLAPNATVMSWRGTAGAIEAARQKHNVIMTPTSYCYFDYYQSKDENEPLAIGGYLPLEKVYIFNPIPEELTKEESKYVLGAQGNVWTEYMASEKQVEYMVFPRILAMSEVVWSKTNTKDYQNFLERLKNFNSRLDALKINYSKKLN
ncbi:MAG: beta-N-acetylhexosaminidase [Flavobacteriaceae bacterium]|nr:beta-N-acetylhexosaminidase [Flavobacteriaceae bacterium]